MLVVAMAVPAPGAETMEVTRTAAPRAAVLDAPRTPLEAGARLGRYLVIDEVGRGGMGVVFRAYDPRLCREVALKSLHAAELTAGAHAMLLHEAQTMAKLSHPNVVAVYDVESNERGVVLAMEYVDGVSLATCLAERTQHGRAAWRSILERFIAAGRGLAAAHAAGVVHRDFKPANVLVGRDGRVRVTDFGIAAAMVDQRVLAGEIAGTVRYMAPEQHAGAEVGPAVDQYAFCVALFESLTGTPAFDARGEALKKVKSLGPPRWPGAAAVPARVTRAILRGLAPRPEERWPSMDALLDALARAQTRRIAPSTVASAGVVVLGASSIAWAAWQQQRAELCSGGDAQIASLWNEERRARVEQAMLATQRPYAADALRRIVPRLDAYAHAWAARHREACEATTVRGEQTAALMDLQMACLRRSKAQLATTVELLVEADATTVENAQQLVDHLPSSSRCRDAEALAADVMPPSEADEEAVESIRLELAQMDALQAAGKTVEAANALAEISARAATIAYAPLRAEVALQAGYLDRARGRPEDSHAALREALVFALRHRQRFEAAAAARTLVQVAGWDLASPERARAFIPVAQALSEKHGVEKAELHVSLAEVHNVEASPEAAEREYRAALALLENDAEPTDLAFGIRRALGAMLHRVGRIDEAEQMNRTLLEELKRVYGAEHPDTVVPRVALAWDLRRLGRIAEAETLYRDAVAVAHEAFEPGHREIAWTLNNLAVFLVDHGRHDEALPVLERALALWEKLPLQPAEASAHLYRADLLHALQRDVEAIDALHTAAKMFDELYGPRHHDVRHVHERFARSLRSLGRHDEAHRHDLDKLTIELRYHPPDHEHVAAARAYVGQGLLALGRLDEAQTQLRTALVVLEARLGADHEAVRFAQEQLAAVAAGRAKRTLAGDPMHSKTRPDRRK